MVPQSFSICSNKSHSLQRMRVQGDLISKKYASGQPVLVVSSGLNESRDVGGRQADVEPVAAICAVCDRDPGPLRVRKGLPQIRC